MPNLTPEEEAFVVEMTNEANKRIAKEKGSPQRSPLQEERYQRVLMQIKIWEKKQKTAATKLAKLYEKRRYYDGITLA